MIQTRRYLLTSAVILLLQAVLDNLLDFSTLLYPAPIAAVIFLMPVQLRGIPALFAAFAAGLLSDLLGNGILGLNAAALTAAALVRYPLLQWFTPENALEKYICPSRISMGYSRFLLFLTLLYLLFFLIALPVEGAGLDTPGFLLLRTAVSTAANVALVFILSVLLSKE